MEFWVGWFDAWGDQAHHVTDGAVSAQDLDLILQQGSVNIYMFCGGTSFGWMNGSNNTDHLTPDVTSYDYDALLTEDGRITEKYLQFRKVIAKYVPLPPLELPQDAPRCTFGPIPISASAHCPKAHLQKAFDLWVLLIERRSFWMECMYKRDLTEN